MGYFKRRREERDNAVAQKVMGYIAKQGQVTEVAVKQAVRAIRREQEDHDVQFRKHLAELIMNDPIISQAVILEVAEVINKKSKMYNYRIAKSKREELAEDILATLSIVKK